MARSKLSKLPPSWQEPLRAALGDRDSGLVGTAVGAVRGFSSGGSQGVEAEAGVKALAAALVAVAREASHPHEVRMQALAAVPGRLESVDAALFAYLLENLDAARPPAHRLAAAGLLGRSRLDRSQLDRLAEAVAAAGPMELGLVLGAFAEADDEGLGRRVTAALGRSRGLGGVRPEQVRAALAKFPKTVHDELAAELSALETGAAEARAALDSLEKSLKPGDRERGRRVFEGPKAACLTCHMVGYVGGRVGPDLTRIGAIRSPRDLLEGVFFPHASFVRSYEPVVVVLKDGRTLSGLLREESASVLVVVTAATSEERIERAEVRDIQPSSVSIMPGGLLEQLSAEEVADLMEFLRSLR
jgi:putative heme-binding domain-containing protein